MSEVVVLLGSITAFFGMSYLAVMFVRVIAERGKRDHDG